MALTLRLTARTIQFASIKFFFCCLPGLVRVYFLRVGIHAPGGALAEEGAMIVVALDLFGNCMDLGLEFFG